MASPTHTSTEASSNGTAPTNGGAGGAELENHPGGTSMESADPVPERVHRAYYSEEYDDDQPPDTAPVPPPPPPTQIADLAAGVPEQVESQLLPGGSSGQAATARHKEELESESQDLLRDHNHSNVNGNDFWQSMEQRLTVSNTDASQTPMNAFFASPTLNLQQQQASFFQPYLFNTGAGLRNIDPVDIHLDGRVRLSVDIVEAATVTVERQLGLRNIDPVDIHLDDRTLLSVDITEAATLQWSTSLVSGTSTRWTSIWTVAASSGPSGGRNFYSGAPAWSPEHRPGGHPSGQSRTSFSGDNHGRRDRQHQDDRQGVRQGDNHYYQDENRRY